MSSGLDSASSISLMNSLARISQLGVTVCATLHQPRIEIFDIINMLYLLAPGGRVAYFGPGFGLASHMRQLGFHCPPSSNISDFVMDVISGFVQPAWDSNASVKATVAHICDYTYQTMHPTFEKEVLLSRKRTGSGIFGRVVTPEDIEAMKSAVSPWHTLRVCFNRQLKVYNRTMATRLSPPYVHLLMGVLISKLFGTVRLEGDLAAQVMSSQLAFAITIQPIALRLFQSDSLMRRREDEGGIKMAPLYLGKLLGNYMDHIVSPLAFTCGYYPFLRALAPIHEYIFLFFLLMLTVTGITNFCSVMFGKYAGTMAGGILIVLWAVGGLEPTVTKTRENLGFIGEILIFITPYRKTYEMAIVMELQRHSEYFQPIIDLFYNHYSLKENRYGLSVMYLLLHWITTNTMAMLAMVWMRDNFVYWREFKDSYVYPCMDRVFTSELFIAIENAWDALSNRMSACDESMSRSLKRLFIALGIDENLDDDLCDSFYQDLVSRGMSGDDMCERCPHIVKHHKHQKALSRKFGLSSQARQRTTAQESARTMHRLSRLTSHIPSFSMRSSSRPEKDESSVSKSTVASKESSREPPKELFKQPSRVSFSRVNSHLSNEANDTPGDSESDPALGGDDHIDIEMASF